MLFIINPLVSYDSIKTLTLYQVATAEIMAQEAEIRRSIRPAHIRGNQPVSRSILTCSLWAVNQGATNSVANGNEYSVASRTHSGLQNARFRARTSYPTSSITAPITRAAIAAAFLRNACHIISVFNRSRELRGNHFRVPSGIAWSADDGHRLEPALRRTLIAVQTRRRIDCRHKPPGSLVRIKETHRGTAPVFGTTNSLSGRMHGAAILALIERTEGVGGGREHFPHRSRDGRTADRRDALRAAATKSRTS